jgi:hypothetical protein
MGLHINFELREMPPDAFSGVQRWRDEALRAAQPPIAAGPELGD